MLEIRKYHLYGVILALFFYTSPMKLIGSLHAAHIYIFISIVFLLTRVRVFRFVWFDLFVLIGILKLFLDMLAGHVNQDTIFSHLAFILFSIAFSLLMRVRSKIFNSNALNIFIFFTVIHAGFVIVQFLMFNSGNYSFLNPYGAFSPNGPDPSTSIASPYNPMFQQIKRPNGLNWEPSALGFWLVMSLSLLIFVSNTPKKKLYGAIISIAGILTMSLITWIGMLVIIVIAYLKNNRLNALSKLLLLVGGLGFAVLFSGISHNNLVMSTFERFNEIGKEETSGYLRVMAPLLLLSNSVSIFGETYVGDRSYQTENYFVAVGRSENSGVANSYIEFFYYYGAIGAVALFICLYAFYSENRHRNHFLGVISALIITPLFGGYVFNPIYFYSVFTYTLFFMNFWQASKR